MAGESDTFPNYLLAPTPAFGLQFNFRPLSHPPTFGPAGTPRGYAANPPRAGWFVRPERVNYQPGGNLTWPPALLCL